jgi:hypothetical protein
MEQLEPPTSRYKSYEGSLEALLEQLPPCELRLVQRRLEPEGQERLTVVCGASGGPDEGVVLARAGEDTSFLEATCRACPIPGALKARQSCLHLVPVRRFPGQGDNPPEQVAQALRGVKGIKLGTDELRTSFPCRYFYTVGTQAWSPDTFWCKRCLFWFPRPPVEMIPQYWETSRRVIAVIDGKEPLGNRLNVPPPSPPRRRRRSPWRWLREHLLQPGK